MCRNVRFVCAFSQEEAKSLQFDVVRRTCSFFVVIAQKLIQWHVLAYQDDSDKHSASNVDKIHPANLDYLSTSPVHAVQYSTTCLSHVHWPVASRSWRHTLPFNKHRQSFTSVDSLPTSKQSFFRISVDMHNVILYHEFERPSHHLVLTLDGTGVWGRCDGGAVPILH